MLLSLKIKNVALIKDVEINFSKDLNVITGETGAGKSMIIKSLGLISGARITNGIVRKGTEKAEVIGVFNKSDFSKEVLDLLISNDIDIDDEDEIIIRRIIKSNGNSKAYINQIPVNQKFLSNLSKSIVSILSQHQYGSLFDLKSQLEILDKFSKNYELVKKVKNTYKFLKEKEYEFKNLKEKQSDYLKRVDYLKYQIQEINGLDFKRGEEEEIKNVVERSKNSENIKKTLYEIIKISSEDENSISNKLNYFISSLNLHEDKDPRFKDLLNKLNETIVNLDDFTLLANKVFNSYDIDEEEANIYQEKFDELNRLKKKFSTDSLESILNLKENMEKELNGLEGIEESIEKLKLDIEEIKTDYFSIAKKLSKNRKENASKLEDKVKKTLKDLGMFLGGFKINFYETNESENGIDKVEYLISTNVGENLKPISKVASGGELSRLMLSLQASTNESYDVGIQVFDEVDIGVGGDVAKKVGTLLKTISKNNQTIVITHLPQISSFADKHIKVWKKQDSDKRTSVMIMELKENEKIKETARMFGIKDNKDSYKTIEKLISEE
jgi:DNA repair protein RecN (Recombination protein N)